MLHHRNNIIVTGCGGLGSKLISFMSAIRISAEYDIDIIIRWAQNQFTCGHRSFFGDVPYMTDCNISLGCNESPELVGLCFMCGPPCNIASNALLLLQHEQHIAHKIGSFRAPISATGSLPSHPDIWQLFSRMSYHFSKLPLNPYVSDTIDKLLPLYDSDTIGIHLRKKWLYNRHKPAKDKQIYNLLEKYNKFYLATDCVPTENRFRKRYGSRMISCPKQARPVVWDYTSNAQILCHMGTYPPAAQQDAFIDILMLSKTNGIIINGSSSFSLCSAVIGCIPLLDVCPYDRILSPEEFEYSKNNTLS